MEIYNNIKSKVLEIIDDAEMKDIDKKELMTHIIGES